MQNRKYNIVKKEPDFVNESRETLKQALFLDIINNNNDLLIYDNDLPVVKNIIKLLSHYVLLLIDVSSNRH